MNNESVQTRNNRYDNGNYRRDLNVSIELNRWILRLIGVWPNRLRHSLLGNLQRRFLNLVSLGLLAFILVPGCMYIVFELKHFYNQSIMKAFSALSFFLMAIIKLCTLILRENDIRRCIECIESDWRRVKHVDDRKVMLENAKFGRKLVIICSAFMYGSVVFYYTALRLIRGKIVDLEDGNLTYRPLLYPVPRYLVDTRYSPVNEIFYMVQLMSGLVARNVSVAACGMAALLATHACGQLQVLMVWLDNLVDGRKDVKDTFDERLANVIEQHVRVINFIELTEKILQEISLVEVVGCTINMCFLGYYSMTEWAVMQLVSGMMYVLLLVSVTFNIFIFCYIGERLADQTMKVAEKTYMIDWHRIAGKRGLAITLIISMSNSTSRMTAGNLVELSIRSFGNVVKTSVAYLNMLRALET